MLVQMQRQVDFAAQQVIGRAIVDNSMAFDVVYMLTNMPNRAALLSIVPALLPGLWAQVVRSCMKLSQNCAPAELYAEVAHCILHTESFNV
jgi:hypothetical protein